jgi:hypothetical protein
VQLIQENGQPLHHEAVASNLIVPAPDMTLNEAETRFQEADLPA